jgi:ribonuclease HI
LKVAPGTSQISSTTSIHQLNCARGQGTTISAVHAFLEDGQQIALLLQEPWIDTTCLPPTHPDLILLTPTPTRPKCATYVKRLPNVSAVTVFQHSNCFLGVEISLLSPPCISPPPSTSPTSSSSSPTPAPPHSTTFTLYNFYSPGRPTQLHTLLKSGFLPSADCLLMGDFNAHHRWWAADTAANSVMFRLGRISHDAIACWLDEHEFSLQNEVGRPTHHPRNGGSPTVIDLCLTRGLVTGIAKAWSIDDDSSSDHSRCGIILELGTPFPIPSEPRRNWKRVNWSAFAQSMSSFSLPLLDSPASALESVALLTNAIQVATDAAVPLVPHRPRYAPWWTSGLSLLRRQLLQTERRFRKTRSVEDQGRCKILRERWRTAISKAKSSYWADILESSGPTDIHRTIKRHRNTHQRPIPPINGETSFVGKSSALFEGLFPTPPTAKHQPITTNTASSPFNFPPGFDISSLADLSNEYSSVTTDETARVLACLNAGSAVGPDKISYSTIRKVHEFSPKLLPKLFTALLRFSVHPQEWKTANCVILPKPGKPDYSLPRAYRPISLLPCLGKILERIVADRTADAALRCGALIPSQLGARSGVSPTDALIRTLQPAAHPLGFKRCSGQTPDRPALLTHDVQGAFDAVIPEVLVAVLRRRGMPKYICDWVSAFCSNRSVCLSFDGQIDLPRLLLRGLPQGSPISPVLFLVYVAVALEKPSMSPGAVTDTSYVDDVNALALGKTPELVTQLLQERTDLQLLRAAPLSLTFAPGKSDLVHFVPGKSKKPITALPPDSLQNLTIILPSTTSSATNISPSHSIGYLGVTVDERLSFREHALNAAACTRQTLNSFRFLGGRRDRGVINYRTRRHLVMSVLLPKMLWASPLWWLGTDPVLSALQLTYNECARWVTGLPQTTHIPKLLIAASLPPLKIYLDYLSSQYASRLFFLPHYHALLQPALSILETRATNPRFQSNSTRPGLARVISLLPTLPNFPLENPDPHPGPQPHTRFPPINLGPSVHSGKFSSSSYLHSRWITTLDSGTVVGYSDGSRFQSNSAGSGFSLFRIVDGCEQFISSGNCSLGTCTTPLDAELHAVSELLAAAENICETPKSLTICTDSSSAIKILSKNPWSTENSRIASESAHRLRLLGCPVAVVYVPSHSGIHGNELADRLAKQGALADTPCPGTRITRDWLKLAVKSQFLTAWQEAAKVAPISLSPAKIYSSLTWSETRAILKIFTNRTPSDPFKLAEEPQCACGGAKISAVHLLVSCPLLAASRLLLQNCLPPNIPLDQDLAVRSPATAKALADYARKTRLGFSENIKFDVFPAALQASVHSPPHSPHLPSTPPPFEVFE